MVNKPGWLEEAIAKPDGYYTEGGEKLKGVMLTPQQIAEWNGTSSTAHTHDDGTTHDHEGGDMDHSHDEPEMLTEAPTSGKDLNEMSKRELEEMGREHGIELDRRERKETLIEKLNEVMD